jgi:hypothetical protein
MDYYNNTGWEIGQRFLFDLPSDFKMSVAIENSHFYEDELGRIQLTGLRDPHHAQINCMVVKKMKDGDEEYFYFPIDNTDQVFEEQANFWRYCAEIKQSLLEELEQQEIINKYKTQRNEQEINY